MQAQSIDCKQAIDGMVNRRSRQTDDERTGFWTASFFVLKACCDGWMFGGVAVGDCGVALPWYVVSVGLST